MTDYLFTDTTVNDINSVSELGLAHIGDAVFELLVRSYLISSGLSKSKELHNMTVKLVSASAQARAIKLLLKDLTEKETAVYKRGRNAKVHSIPKNCTVADYHSATGLESLFGFLYLSGEKDRIIELFSLILKNMEGIIC